MTYAGGLLGHRTILNKPPFNETRYGERLVVIFQSGVQ